MTNPFDTFDAFDPTADSSAEYTAQTNTDSTARTDNTNRSAEYDSAGYTAQTNTEHRAEYDAEDYDRYASEGTYQGPHSDWNLPTVVWVYIGLSVLSMLIGLILIASN